MLSSPSAPNVILRRKLTRNVSPAPIARFDSDDIKETEAQPLAKAIWAPSNSALNDSERCLEGEIIIPLSCIPSFRFGGFILEVSSALGARYLLCLDLSLLRQYFIDMLPPSPAGFQSSSKDTILSRTPINIASAHPEGSYRPRAYIAPAHDVSRRVAHADALVALQGGTVERGTPASRPSTGSATQKPLPRDLQEASGAASSATSRPKRASRRFSTF